jgi:hypothetical protein
VAWVGTLQVEVVVESWVLPASAGAEGSGEPTVAATGEAGRWGCVGTPPSIPGEHYRTE